MANAKKLPSGNWRIRVYSHTDAQGRKHYESFTASTKQEAEMLGAKFANDAERKRTSNITVLDALKSYIESNKDVLSPSTIYGYEKAANRMATIHHIRIRKLTSKDIQDMINDLQARGMSSKTIKNTYGVLRSSLAFCGLEKKFKIHLPPTTQKPPVSPEYDEIKLLYDNASRKMKIAIALASYCSLRRGEIASIKFGDINGDTINIHSDMVWGRDNKWHYKDTPKTSASNRIIYVPEPILEMIGTGNPNDYILGIYPNGIGENFSRLKKKVGVNITFHQLRHFFASMAVLLGVPDSYTAHLGGWRNGSKTLKNVYQNNMRSKSKEYGNLIRGNFAQIDDNMTRNMPREKENPAQP